MRTQYFMLKYGGDVMGVIAVYNADANFSMAYHKAVNAWEKSGDAWTNVIYPSLRADGYELDALDIKTLSA